MRSGEPGIEDIDLVNRYPDWCVVLSRQPLHHTTYAVSSICLILSLVSSHIAGLANTNHGLDGRMRHCVKLRILELVI